MSDSLEPDVFISYDKKDVKAAKQLHVDLKQVGITPWIDEVSLLPGQKIQLAEKQAIRNSRFFVALLSSNSVRKGRVIKQINWAMDVSDEMPEGEIHIIPIRLEECEPPHERVGELYIVDMFRDWEDGLGKIISVIRSANENEEKDGFDGSAGHRREGAGESDNAAANSSGRSDSVASLPNTGVPSGPVKNRWALLVGVNRYVELNFPSLRFCVNDVVALEKLLGRAGYTVVSLHDDAEGEHLAPTRENVEAELVRLCGAAQEDDLLLVYFACHGKLADDEPLLITREIRQPTLKDRALPLAMVEEYMRQSKARGLFLILDACHTGVETGRDITDPEFIHNVHEKAEGFALIAASTAQQIAQEWGEKEHGVFSYYLLEGLSGRADHQGKGFVTADDLKNHVLNELRKWSVAHGGLIQEPTARTEGMGDMIIADYRDNLGADPSSRNGAGDGDTPNPFGDIGRIEDPNRFFDREELLRRIFEELNKGSNISLVGESQIGKSSVLSMIRAMGPERMNLPPEAFVYLTMEWVDDEDDFYETFCHECGIENCRGGRLRRALTGKRCILCLDEIEKMAWDGFTEKVRGHLRGLADGSSAPLTLVIASRSPLDHLFPDSPELTSPLAGICMKMDVGPFSPDVARTFIAHRLKRTGTIFTDDEIESLLKKSEGHPAKLQQSAARMYDRYRFQQPEDKARLQ